MIRKVLPRRREVLGLPLLAWSQASAQERTSRIYESGAIQPSRAFPYIWEYRGKPTLLLGASDEDNLFNHPQLAAQNLAKLARAGGNYVRCTMSSRDPGNVWPYTSNDGKFDLDTWNGEYWQRFEKFLTQARELNVIVQIELWATFDFYREQWNANPYNPANNSQLTTANSKLEKEWPHHPARKPQPFFFSVPGHNNAKALLALQERYVEKLLSISLQFPNVLYCSDNETRAPKEWGEHWAEFVRRKARDRGYDVPFTEMWDAHDLRSPEHAQTYTRPDLYPYVEVSQNNWKVGEEHYQTLLWYRENLKANGGPRPMNNVKVYQRLEGGKPNDAAVSVRRWWQNVFAGCASTRFHRPDGGIGLNSLAVQQVFAARKVTDEVEWWRAVPAPERVKDKDGEACVLSIPGEAHLVYLPKGGPVQIALDEGDPVLWRLRWMNLTDATLRQPRRAVARGGTLSMRALSTDPWIAVVTIR